jgi:F420-0:gamma-glutamyl ligase
VIPQAVCEPGLPPGLVAIPIRTRLIGPGDDLAALVAHAVGGIARRDDVIAIAETAVAIAQRRFVAAEYVRPSPLAYALARRAGALATVNQPESLQLVIDDVGPRRVVFAALAHIVGRLRGKRGVFYEKLGAAIAAIDGYTGTLPPYERAIVFGPADPDRVCAELRDRLGFGFAIVDANDLRRAKALGVSPDVVPGAVEAALLANPHGNGDEQTPIVILTWRGSGPNPLRVAA